MEQIANKQYFDSIYTSYVCDKSEDARMCAN